MPGNTETLAKCANIFMRLFLFGLPLSVAVMVVGVLATADWSHTDRYAIPPALDLAVRWMAAASALSFAAAAVLDGVIYVRRSRCSAFRKAERLLGNALAVAGALVVAYCLTMWGPFR